MMAYYREVGGLTMKNVRGVGGAHALKKGATRVAPLG